MHQILAKLFTSILEDPNEDIDLRDRAAFYYRILQQNTVSVKTLLDAPLKILEKFQEEQIDKNELLQLEFNTLGVIF